MPDCIVLHYTGMRDGAAAVSWLCDPASQVSAHYVVMEEGAVLQLVEDDRRAWHAGQSFWLGETDLNSRAIGIEIVNGGHDYGVPSFPDRQIAAVIRLGHDLTARHNIPPERLLAHSDIAPRRKRDPGERFPWQRLAEAGVGLWPSPAAPAPQDWTMASVVAGLARIGYPVLHPGAQAGDEEAAIAAFQRRYRPHRIDGRADGETAALVDAVLQLHRPGWRRA